MAHFKFDHHKLVDVPEFENREEAIHYLENLSDKFCIDKVRLFLIESEGKQLYYGPYRLKPLDLRTQILCILRYEYCMKDEHFVTGWLERDGNCRSNCYTGHSDALRLIGMDSYPEAERKGWIHVSSPEYGATVYYEPTRKQIAVLDRTGHKWNSEKEYPKWRSPRKNATEAELTAQLASTVGNELR